MCFICIWCSTSICIHIFCYVLSIYIYIYKYHILNLNLYLYFLHLYISYISLSHRSISISNIYIYIEYLYLYLYRISIPVSISISLYVYLYMYIFLCALKTCIYICIFHGVFQFQAPSPASSWCLQGGFGRMVLKGSGASAVAGGFKSLVPSPELMMMTMIKMRLVFLCS